LTDWYRRAFGELYPLVYPHRDVAEAARVASRLVAIVHRDGPMLDVACGNGRYMCALAAEGVDVYGVDLSEYLLAGAVQHGLAGRVACGDMRALPFATDVFGSAINMFTSFGYFDDDADNARALAEIARVVRPRGAFVLDFINALKVRRAFTPRSRRAVSGAEVEEQRELADGGRVLVKRVRVCRPAREAVEYAERLRLYTRDELTTLLSASGFAVRGVHGDYALRAFDGDASERLIMVCEKEDR
jgi:SAM-dependent methyltransferase